MDPIPVLTNGKTKILEAVYEGAPIVQLMNEQVELCFEFGETIIRGRTVGTGVGGAIEIVTIEEKEYVVKIIKTSLSLKVKKFETGTSIDAIYQEISLSTGIPMNVIQYYNRSVHLVKATDPDASKWLLSRYSLGLEGINVVIPQTPEHHQCLTDEDMEVRRLDGKGVTVLKSGSYLCSDETYSEFVNASLVSSLLEYGLINFIKVYGFAICLDPKMRRMSPEFTMKLPAHQYIFMEKVDGTFAEYAEKMDEEDFISCTIQLLFSISAYQEMFSISHNDLHGENILVQIIDEDSPYFRYEYFSYSVFGREIFFPRGKYVVKIGDFGFSIKWKVPVVGKRDFFEGEDELVEMPNWYSRIYDLAYSLDSIKFIIEEIAKKEVPEFLTNIIDYTMRGEKNFFYGDDWRPKISKLEKLKDMNSTKVLLSAPMEKYYAHPDANIAAIGILES